MARTGSTHLTPLDGGKARIEKSVRITIDPQPDPPTDRAGSLQHAMLTHNLLHRRWVDEFMLLRSRKFALDSTTRQKDSKMTDMSDILEKLDKISMQHQSEIHRLETRMDSRVTEVTNSLYELRRDTREDLREMKATVVSIKETVDDLKDATRKAIDDVKESTQTAVDGVNKSNKAIAWTVGGVGLGLIIATIWAVYYGTWTILGTLTSILQVVPHK